MAVRKDLSIEYLGVMCETFLLPPGCRQLAWLLKLWKDAGGVFFKRDKDLCWDECSQI